MRIRVAGAVLAVLLLSMLATAQEQTGSIQGVLTDSTGGVLPGVTVEVRSPTLGRVISTTTDGNGTYRFLALQPGKYEVSATLSGFAPTKVPNVEVALGQIKKVDMTMTVGGVSQELTVTGEAPLIDVKQSATAASIRDEMIEKLPRGRSFTSVVTQASGANDESKLGGISIDGASGSENRYVVDGIDTTNLQTGVNAKGVITDFVDEVQVKSSGYAAEYGGATGGVISVVTKSGGVDYRGEVGMYFSADNLNGPARPSLRLNPSDITVAEYITYPKDDYTSFEPGVQVGGPMFKDKAWFFAGYYPTWTAYNRTVTFQPSNLTQGYLQKNRSHNANANITAQFSDKLRGKASLNLSPGYRYGTLPSYAGTDNPNINFSGLDAVSPNTSLSGNLDYSATNHLYFSGRGGYFRYNYHDKGIPNEIWRQFSGSNLMFPEIPPELQQRSGYRNILTNDAVTRDMQSRLSINFDGTYFANWGGEHAIKAGIQFDRVANDVFRGYQQPRYIYYWNAAYTFLDGHQDRGKYGFYRALQIVTTGDVSSNNVGLFAQDSWTIGKKLTLNFGVRSESEKVPSYTTAKGEDPNAIDFGFADKVAPRAGFSYDVKGDGRWKAFGSWGIFYDITKLEMPRGLFGGDQWVDYFYALDDYNWPELGDGCLSGCPGRFFESIDRRYQANAVGLDAIEPDLKPMKQQELTLGVAHELSRSTSLGVRYVYKRLDRTIEDVGVTRADIGAEVFYIANPGEGIAQYPLGPDNPPLPKAQRTYHGLELDFRKRMSERWTLHASYLYSRLYGNYSGLASSDEGGRTSPNVNRFFDSIVLLYDENGNQVAGLLPTDRPHTFKVQGLYDFPFGLTVGSNIVIQSGTPVSRTVSLPPDLPVFYMGRKSDGRTPTFSQFDVYLQHEWRFADGTALQFQANVTNLFDQKTATDIYADQTLDDLPDVTPEQWINGQVKVEDLLPYVRPDARFLMESAFQGGRAIRLGMKYIF